jgi:hypothetical protein
VDLYEHLYITEGIYEYICIVMWVYWMCIVRVYYVGLNKNNHVGLNKNVCIIMWVLICLPARRRCLRCRGLSRNAPGSARRTAAKSRPVVIVGLYEYVCMIMWVYMSLCEQQRRAHLCMHVVVNDI